MVTARQGLLDSSDIMHMQCRKTENVAVMNKAVVVQVVALLLQRACQWYECVELLYTISLKGSFLEPYST